MTPVGDRQRLWLFKVNAQGCFGGETCGELVITDTQDQLPVYDEIEIYPNPVAHTLQIDVAYTQIEAVSIYSQEGKEVRSLNSFTSHELDVSCLIPGVYILQIVTSHGMVVKQFTKL